MNAPATMRVKAVRVGTAASAAVRGTGCSVCCQAVQRGRFGSGTGGRRRSTACLDTTRAPPATAGDSHCASDVPEPTAVAAVPTHSMCDTPRRTQRYTRAARCAWRRACSLTLLVRTRTARNGLGLACAVARAPTTAGDSKPKSAHGQRKLAHPTTGSNNDKDTLPVSTPQVRPQPSRCMCFPAVAGARCDPTWQCLSPQAMRASDRGRRNGHPSRHTLKYYTHTHTREQCRGWLLVCGDHVVGATHDTSLQFDIQHGTVTQLAENGRQSRSQDGI